MSIITLTTDFGLGRRLRWNHEGRDPGGSRPDARLVDVSHDIAPQDIVGAAYVLARAIRIFRLRRSTSSWLIRGSAARAARFCSDGRRLFRRPDNACSPRH